MGVPVSVMLTLSVPEVVVPVLEVVLLVVVLGANGPTAGRLEKSVKLSRPVVVVVGVVGVVGGGVPGT